jgi:predicted  nucleic acid-binding Zn-ribbon protein
MNQITLLAELQDLDTRSDKNADLRGTLETKLADVSALDTARAAVERDSHSAAELRSKLRALELETSGLADKLKQVNERLYSGRITNAKELADLNRDEKMLERRKSDLEDRSLVLMEQLEIAERSVSEKQTSEQKISVETTDRRNREQTQLDKLHAEQANIDRKRQSLRAQLPTDALRVYDQLRQTKKGRAVVRVQAASCVACGTAVPSGLISRLKLGTELVFCTNCERILAP